MAINLEFREQCHKHGLAATHQRQVIYETVQHSPGHPSPEAIYEKVQKRIPSISLATVYKNLKTFLDRGMLQEVSLHHGSLRIETNRHPHHHLVCTDCKKIVDLDEREMETPRLNEKSLRGFEVKRISIDVLGLCAACAAKSKRES
jgi:Fur family peroxide stress response transcriptional regulator